ncbi:beta-hexosaminidase precursor [Bacteroides pyogenes JCM 6292]|uniref:Beta-hexosaminidase n=1 Tax=Bacteroides pyogenes JCM 6292 TaxID=1235809 RepID=W4P3M7_9BACE|nr:beta-hexosaminidase precursor [Bacteroides pyogenes JCM 6292]
MEIKNRYVQVYLFLWIMGMCMYAHPLKCQSVIPAPLKMERGIGSFPLSGGVRLYTGICGGRCGIVEKQSEGIACGLEASEEERRTEYRVD